MKYNYVCLVKPKGGSVSAECPDGVAPSTLFQDHLGTKLEAADDLVLQDRVPIYSSSQHLQDVRNCFDVLAAKMAQHLTSGRQLVVIVDEVDLCRLNPMRNRGWESLIAMLIMAYPEIRWIFGKIRGCPRDEETDLLREQWNRNSVAATVSQQIIREIGDLRKHWKEIRDSHSIDLLFEPLGSPLFDDGGLRHWIRTITRLDTHHDRVRDVASYLCRRRDLAVVLDEERDFRTFHALIAYGRGLRVNAIESWAQARRSLAVVQFKIADDRTYEHLLTIEDLFLNYPDQTVFGLSDLEKRVNTENLPLLTKFRHRRYVTVGHDQSGKRRTLNYQLREQRSRHFGRFRLRPAQQLILKPAAGIHSLWRSMGLNRHMRDELSVFNLQGNHSSCRSDGHSSPGRLLDIAECLITRAKERREEINSVSDAVNCAVLAIQAYELLGGLTPVLSLEALTLRHEFEVIAECQFAGVQHRLDVANRLSEIRNQVRSVSRYFGSTRKKRRIAALNSELAIVGRLIDVFRKYDQFDEEQFLLTRLRRIHRNLLFAELPVFAKPFEVFPAYAERLLASFPLFVFTIFAWIGVLGLTHWQLTGVNPDEGVAAAFMTFLGTGSSGGESVWKPGDGWTVGFWLVSTTVLLGFIHLGIFISHLYTIINRK